MIAPGNDKWDVIVIGGGITGAGIFNEAARRGYKTLLIEAKDFAQGTSSKSSKMVHGGLRYLSYGHFKLTWGALKERESLLRDLPGLVTPLTYLLPAQKWRFPFLWMLKALIKVYDLLASRRSLRVVSPAQLPFYFPSSSPLSKAFQSSSGGVLFEDALTDDCRLVLRTLQEGRLRGGQTLNYTRVERLERNAHGHVEGVYINFQTEDLPITPLHETKVHHEPQLLRAKLVINATGAWSDELRLSLGSTQTLKHLRGSHLVFAPHTLPINHVISLFHPKDRRPVYVYPWCGVVIVGTTDLYEQNCNPDQVRISQVELDYLLEAINSPLINANVDARMIISTFAGIRTVLSPPGNKNASHPGKEKRDFGLLWDHGMLTVTGGKLTTFRTMAKEALDQAVTQLGDALAPQHGGFFTSDLMADSFNELDSQTLPPKSRQRLAGYFGPQLTLLRDGAWEPIPNTPYYWQEVDFSLKHERVVHLDDLLLRRTRLGLILPQGGISLLDELMPRFQKHLGWSTQKWDLEVKRYNQLWQHFHGVSGDS